ncbi:MAG: polysaccharide pyruvyl transferase family protein [Ruminococcus sp.]|nr:polysaccharide pyruvyl transferase family protein [Ruminococcus sp.]
MKNTVAKTSATITWFTGNYGSIFQAYALQQAQQKMGMYNTIINYQPNSNEKLKFFLTSSARSVTLKSKIDARKIQKDFMSKENIAKKNRRFDAFYSSYLNLTDPIYSQDTMGDISNEYDCYICGSDQIWNPAYFKKCQFLDFASDSKRKIAYAPSVGTTQLSDAEKRKMEPLLKRFDCISVREKQSVELIQPMVNIPVQVVCDPVFLLTADDWNQLIPKVQPQEEYIFCYFLGQNEDYIQIAKWLSEKTGLKLKSVPNNYWGYGIDAEIIKTAGPIEWLDLIRNASYVITDSFHATALSIIFNKNFYTLRRFKDGDKASQNSRIYHILDVAGLTERLISIDCCDESVPQIDDVKWHEVNEKMVAYREQSLDWLKSAIRGV